jgi:N-carbamoyl-L-amino-acid hydrolase
MAVPATSAAAALRVDAGRLLADLDALSRFGRQAAGGVTRRAFSPAHAAAQGWLRDRMRVAGLEARVDSVGNLVGRVGPPGPAVLAGSHIDTVPEGGTLDGAYGVLAALECARVIVERGLPLSTALEVVAFADEEGAYLSLLGSRGMAGRLTSEEVRAATAAEGGRLVEAMAAAGLDPEEALAARRAPGDLRAYVELHIEQGPVLERLGVPIGVVEGIVGIAEIDYRFVGAADHAGTTPMALRRDALRAAAAFITHAHERFAARSSEHARMTFGAVQVRPNVPNVVPRETLLRQELRDLSTEGLTRLGQESGALAREIAAGHGVEVHIHQASLDEPAIMSPTMIRRIHAACERLGFPCRPMPSGAGHDAQVMALICETGMIFVPSHGGASHRPDEWTDPGALERGANVLLQTLLDLL